MTTSPTIAAQPKGEAWHSQAAAEPSRLAFDLLDPDGAVVPRSRRTMAALPRHGLFGDGLLVQAAGHPVSVHGHGLRILAISRAGCRASFAAGRRLRPSALLVRARLLVGPRFHFYTYEVPTQWTAFQWSEIAYLARLLLWHYGALVAAAI